MTHVHATPVRIADLVNGDVVEEPMVGMVRVTGSPTLSLGHVERGDGDVYYVDTITLDHDRYGESGGCALPAGTKWRLQGNDLGTVNRIS